MEPHDRDKCPPECCGVWDDIAEEWVKGDSDGGDPYPAREGVDFVNCRSE